jgi:hypothetical protein
MPRIAKKIFIITVAIFAVVACQTKADKNYSSNLENKNNTQAQVCSNPRPEICTREYKPVCAVVDTKVRCVKAPCPSTIKKTYSNSCTACSDNNVYEYSLGVCK